MIIGLPLLVARGLLLTLPSRSDSIGRMKRILPFLALLVTSCAAPFNTHFSDIHVGMSRAEVTKLLGKPVGAEGEGGSEVLYYRLASSFMDSDGSDTREYWVRLQNGGVTGYGERNDFAAAERSRKQYQAAWGALGSIQRTQELVTPRQVDVNVHGGVQHNVNVQGNVRHDVNGTLFLR